MSKPTARTRKHGVLMLLSNPFRPDPRVHKEAKALAEAGHPVRILCWAREGGFERREIVDGIRIQRVRIPSGYSSPLRFVLALPFFWANIVWNVWSGTERMVHCHDLDTLPAGWFASRLSGKVVVFDAHERYAEMIRDDVPAFVYRLTERLEEFLVPRVDLVVMVNDRFKDHYSSKGALRTLTIMGCDPLEDAEPDLDAVRGLERPVLVYVGVLEPTRMILEAARAVSECEHSSMLIGGFGSLEDGVRAVASPCVRFMGRVPPNRVRKIDAACDLLMAVYDPSNVNNADSVPNKLFEAMSVGRPIVVAKGTFSAEVVEKEGCGYVIEYGDVDALRNILLEMRKDPSDAAVRGKRGMEAYRREYNWNAMARRLVKAYAYLGGRM